MHTEKHVGSIYYVPAFKQTIAQNKAHSRDMAVCVPFRRCPQVLFDINHDKVIK